MQPACIRAGRAAIITPIGKIYSDSKYTQTDERSWGWRRAIHS